jgi:hypothetical protein
VGEGGTGDADQTGDDRRDRYEREKRSPDASIAGRQRQGATTGQAVAPLVVQTTRPSIDGETGELAVT